MPVRALCNTHARDSLSAESLAQVKGDSKLELQLFDKIRPDECNWSISHSKLVLTLEKQVSGSWPNLVRWSD